MHCGKLEATITSLFLCQGLCEDEKEMKERSHQKEEIFLIFQRRIFHFPRRNYFFSASACELQMEIQSFPLFTPSFEAIN